MSALCIKNRLTQINSELWAKLGYIQPAKTNYTTDKLKVLTPGSIFRCIFFVFLTLVQTSFTFNLLHYRWANFFKFILIQSTAVSRKGVKQLFGCKTLRQLKKNSTDIQDIIITIWTKLNWDLIYLPFLLNRFSLKRDFLKHKTVKTNDKIRRFRVVMTSLSRKTWIRSCTLQHLKRFWREELT